MRATEAFYEGLRRRALGLCLCWRIDRKDGTSQFFTNHDKALTVEGMTFVPTSSFSASAVSSREDLSVSNMSLTALTTDDIPEDDLIAGVYDEAYITVYLAQWDQVGYGLGILKVGYLGEVVTKGSQFETEIRGLSEKLQRSIGNIYSIECQATLGDSRCQVDVTPYTYTTAIDGVYDGRSFRVPLNMYATYFQYGTCTVTSGKNAGHQTEVMGHTKELDKSWITLREALPFRPSVGDTVSLVRGCSRTLSACKGFLNILNFRGFPFMPTEDVILQSPNAKN